MKKTTLMILICMLSACLTGCINVNIGTSDDDAEKEEEVFEEDDYEADSIAEVEESGDIDDPLAGCDVAYPGELDGSSQITRRIVQKFLDEEGVKPIGVLSVNVNDYEQNGEYGAFILSGVEDKENGGYLGVMYYVTEDKVRVVDDDTKYWRSLGETMKFDGMTFALADDNLSVSEIFTHMWYVYKGKAAEDMVSNFGQIYRYDDDCICVVLSEYDGYYEKEFDMWTGHTYKPFYFFYDTRFNDFVEYGGKELTPDEINMAAGYDIVGEIESLDDYTVTEGFYRKNGILNINYTLENEEAICYYNCTLDVNTGKFIPAYGDEATLEGSDFGGIYRAYAKEEINTQCVYPDEIPNNSGKGAPAGQSASGKSSSGRELTQDELDSFTQYFDNNLNGFLIQDFDDVRDVDLNELLYNGIGKFENPPKEEVNAYLKACGDTEIYTDLLRLYTEDIDDYLRFFTGYKFSDMRNKLNWVYVKEYDAYFLQRGDTNYLPYICVGGKVIDTITENSDVIDVYELKFVVNNGKPYKEGDPYKKVIFKNGELLTQIVSVQTIK